MSYTITREEFDSWLNQPITRLVKAAREADIRSLQVHMGDGGTFDATDATSTSLNTAFNVGYIRGLREALEPPLQFYTNPDEGEEEA